MSKVKSNDERKEFLATLGLTADDETLASVPAKVAAAPSVAAAGDIALAPPGVDPRMQPVDEIVFDPRLLDEFTSLAFNQEGKRASDKVFALYKSYGRDKHRNSALHRKIASFITTERRKRETGGLVTEEVKSTKEQRDIAALLASQGITAADLAALLNKTAEEAE